MKINLKIFLVLAISILFTGCADNIMNTAGSFIKTYTYEDGRKVVKDLNGKLTSIDGHKVIETNVTSDKDILVFILDGSGSMLEVDNKKNVKIDSAKSTLKDIVRQLDKSKTNLGLFTFNKGCRSTEMLVNPGSNDFDLTINQVEQITPSGRTPLAESIFQVGYALKDIKNKKIRVIIISDGQETCGGDPVREIKYLKKYGIDVDLNIIGYSVDNQTKAQLVEMTNIGNGKYFEASDLISLNNVVTQITDTMEIKNENWEGNKFKFNILFDSGSSVLKDKYLSQIKNLSEYLKSTGYSVEVQGHTDNIGDKDYNKTLSEDRAKSVLKALLDSGVDSSKAYAIGYGELVSIADNNTNEGRTLNRRVEAHIIKNGYQNISLVNKANKLNYVDVKYANQNSLIGYYLLKDPNRKYNDYHGYMKLYANNKAIMNESLEGKYIGEKEIWWSYHKNSTTFKLDATNNKGGFMKGLLTGTTNNFNLNGKWSNGTPGSLIIERIDENQLNSMENGN